MVPPAKSVANSSSDSFQNYPYILLDNNLHAVWIDQDGFDVFLEKDAGYMSKFTDADYSSLGVNIDDNHENVSDADVFCERFHYPKMLQVH